MYNKYITNNITVMHTIVHRSINMNSIAVSTTKAERKFIINVVLPKRCTLRTPLCVKNFRTLQQAVLLFLLGTNFA
jgi:hypothetical protein